MNWLLIASGPSATAEQARKAHEAGWRVGAVGNGFQLAPMAEFVAASDRAWWQRYPEAMQVGERYCMTILKEVVRVQITGQPSAVNSGVLGLEVAKRKGATTILLCGFDQQGSHFFGKYDNGLRNTNPQQRQQHLGQFALWKRSNPQVRVINCNSESALVCFPKKSLEEALLENSPISSCA